jgi:dynein heavy chain
LSKDRVAASLFFKLKIVSEDDFEWKRQLKYYFDEHNNQCLIRQSDAQFNYGYEYLGCAPRLVMTPLTDR